MAMRNRTSDIIEAWRSEHPTITYETMAVACGVSSRTIQRWCYGEHSGDKIGVSAIRAMEQVRPGLIVSLFPEAFRRRRR